VGQFLGDCGAGGERWLGNGGSSHACGSLCQCRPLCAAAWTASA
jgi:hypothetical protein